MKNNLLISFVVVALVAAIAFCAYWFVIRENKETESTAGKVEFQRKDAGDIIVRLQNGLNNKGYNLDTDGIFGAQTEKAVLEYFGKKTVTLSDIYNLENS